MYYQSSRKNLNEMLWITAKGVAVGDVRCLWLVKSTRRIYYKMDRPGRHVTFLYILYTSEGFVYTQPSPKYKYSNRAKIYFKKSLIVILFLVLHRYPKSQSSGKVLKTITIGYYGNVYLCHTWLNSQVLTYYIYF